jgi:hypothetical protein
MKNFTNEGLIKNVPTYFYIIEIYIGHQGPTLKGKPPWKATKTFLITLHFT